MQTKVSKRGQTSIPAKIRRAYNIEKNSRLEWIDENGRIIVLPVPDNPVKALKGTFKGIVSTNDILKSRKEERNREKN